MQRIVEATQIVNEIVLDSDETKKEILKIFIREEIGEVQFKTLTFEMFSAMGIKSEIFHI